MKNKLIPLAVTAALFVIFAIGITGAKTAVDSAARAKPVVVLDAGHGSTDNGTIGVGGVSEKVVNLQITMKTKLLLELLGCDVVMTRVNDEPIAESKLADMRLRLKIANTYPGGILLSIHQNFYPDASQHGAQVFFGEKTEGSKQLATILTDTFREKLDPDNRRKIKEGKGHYLLLEKTVVPAVLIECGFMSNPAEAKKLYDENYQMQLAFCIAGAVITFQNGGTL